MILDFEGEPGRPLLDRRRKRSPLRDVAAWSLAGLRRLRRAVSARGRRPGGLGERGARALPRGLHGRGGSASILPVGASAVTKLLAIFELERAVYELRYELDNRPDWVGIPVAVHLAAAGTGRPVNGGRDEDGQRAAEQQRGQQIACAAITRIPITCWAPTRRAPACASPSTGRTRTRSSYIAAAAEGEPKRLRRVEAAGVFSGVVKGAALPLRYELEVHYPDGGAYRLRDPYAFLPTSVISTST